MLPARMIPVLAALAALTAGRAHAANILFVSDSGSDLGIATALMADGHEVTTRMDEWAGGTNPALTEDLSEYDAVYWSQDGSGGGEAVTDAALFANLTDYVENGGRVFVTGYDSIASPPDPLLVAFLGGTGSTDVVGPPGVVAMIENSLTVGVVDIRGVTPIGGVGDTDHMLGLGADTVAVVNSASGGGAQWTLRTLGSGEIAYMSNGSSSASWTNTTAGGPGAFNAAIRNFAGAADAGSTPPGAPEIEFSRTSSGDEGEAITIDVTIVDPEGDDFTYSWDLDGDGTFGENAGMPSYTIAAGTTDGASSVALGVEATDGTNTSTRTRTVRIRNVDPRITSDPPTTTSVGAMIRYTIVVEDPAGPLDPPEFTLVHGPMGAAITEDGVFVWRSTELDVTMADERIAIEVAVSDGDGGMANQAWEMTVSPNHAPSSIVPLYPANGLVIADRQPRLVVTNASDEDIRDTLTYFFEIDDEETFAEPVLARGEMIDQTAGYTAFPLPSPLEPGTYHWRAWAFDGYVGSEPVATRFLVVPDPSVDSGTPLLGDAGPVGVDASRPPPPPDDRGCACAAPGRRSTDGRALGVGLGLLIAVAIRRRARRAP